MFATDFFFEKLSTGETAFYPYGAMSRGYVLTFEQEVEARRRMKRLVGFWVAEFVSMTLLIWFVSFSPVALVLLLGTLALLSESVFHFYLSPVLNPARRAPKLGFKGWLRGLGRVRSQSRATGIFLFLTALLWIFIGMLPQGPNTGPDIAAFFMAAVFVMFGAVHFYAADEHGVKTRR